MTSPAENSPAEKTSPAQSGEDRSARRVVRGSVTSNKMQKTLVVTVHRKVKHPLYEKFMNRSTKLYVHDENGEGRIGDVVEVMQTRPLSRLKRWRLLRVVQRAQD